MSLSLPLELYMSKKYFQKTLGGYILMIVLFIAGFWWGSGSFFTEDYYYPKMVLASGIGFVCIVFATIFHLMEFYKKKPIATITSSGISFHSKPFSVFGEIRWQDISDYREMAFEKNGRKLLLYARNKMDYINKLDKSSQQKRLKKISENNAEALAFIETNKIDCDLAALKDTILKLINKQL